LNHREFQVTQFIQNARVPILKLWDPKTQVSCDICVGGTNALLNTAYLKYYGRIDPRVRPLALAIKYWAMQRGINDSANGTLSSYGYAMLLIFYLQKKQGKNDDRRLLPVIHPVFEKIRQEQNMTAFLVGLENLPFFDTDMATYGEISTQQSVGALLEGFFRFYASEFNYEDQVVSVRTGSSQLKTIKWERSVPWRLSIEDPFELTHDVGRVVFNKKGHELILNEFKRANQLLLDGNSFEEICNAQKDAWYIHATCYICERIDHKARECARFMRIHDTNISIGMENLSKTSSIPAECWYCGDLGHVKALCPLRFFTDIPLETSMVEPVTTPSPSESLLSENTPFIIPSISEAVAKIKKSRKKFTSNKNLTKASTSSLSSQSTVANKTTKKKKQCRSRSGSCVSPPPGLKKMPKIPKIPFLSPQDHGNRLSTSRHHQQHQFGGKKCTTSTINHHQNSNTLHSPAPMIVLACAQ
jgi:DNA polymerase sigma